MFGLKKSKDGKKTAGSGKADAKSGMELRDMDPGNVLKKYERLRAAGDDIPMSVLMYVGDLHRDIQRTEEALRLYGEAARKAIDDEQWGPANQVINKANKLLDRPSVAIQQLSLRVALGQGLYSDAVRMLHSLSDALTPRQGAEIDAVIGIVDREGDAETSVELALSELLVSKARGERAIERLGALAARARKGGKEVQARAFEKKLEEAGGGPRNKPKITALPEAASLSGAWQDPYDDSMLQTETETTRPHDEVASATEPPMEQPARTTNENTREAPPALPDFDDLTFTSPFEDDDSDVLAQRTPEPPVRETGEKSWENPAAGGMDTISLDLPPMMFDPPSTKPAAKIARERAEVKPEVPKPAQPEMRTEEEDLLARFFDLPGEVPAPSRSASPAIAATATPKPEATPPEVSAKPALSPEASIKPAPALPEIDMADLGGFVIPEESGITPEPSIVTDEDTIIFNDTDWSGVDNAYMDIPLPSAAILIAEAPPDDYGEDGITEIVDDDLIDLSGDDKEQVKTLARALMAGIRAHIPSEDAETHFQLGQAFLEMNLFSEASEAYQLASRNPDYRVRAIEGLAQSFFGSGRPNLSYRVIKMVIEEIPKADRLGALYWLGRSAEEIGRVDEAKDSYAEVAMGDISFLDAADRLEALDRQ